MTPARKRLFDLWRIEFHRARALGIELKREDLIEATMSNEEIIDRGRWLRKLNEAREKEMQGG